MSNIIDFNSYKRSRDPELLHPQGEAETLHALDNAFLDYIQAFPSSSLMDDIHNRVANQLQRLESLETISARVSETIAKTGFDPNNFRIDEAHFHAFLMRDIQTVSDELSEWIVDPDIYWNGPYYDWQQGDTLIRAATTILRHEDGDVELLIDLVKMEPGSQHWLMWKDGKWEIDEFLEEIEEELRRRQMKYYSDDDDENDDIFTLGLSLRVIDALGEEGITAISELCAMTEDELLDIYGIGPKAIEEIKEALEVEGLSLKED